MHVSNFVVNLLCKEKMKIYDRVGGPALRDNPGVTVTEKAM